MIDKVRLQRNRACRGGKLPQIDAAVPLREACSVVIASAADVVRATRIAGFEQVVFAASSVDKMNVGDLCDSAALFADVPIHPRELKVAADRHFVDDKRMTRFRGKTRQNKRQNCQKQNGSNQQKIFFLYRNPSSETAA